MKQRWSTPKSLIVILDGVNVSVDTSELKQLILQTVASIPQGKISSYGQVARLCGYPGYARFVGTVLKQLPKDTTLPWHRVINGKGEIAFPIDSEAYIRQHTLLTQEGIQFENNRVPMRIYGWAVEVD